MTEHEQEDRRGIERRVSQVENAIGRMGSDLHDIKAKQLLQKELNEAQFSALKLALEKISLQMDHADSRVDELQLVKASIIGAMNLLKWVGITTIISVFIWITKAVFWGKP